MSEVITKSPAAQARRSTASDYISDLVDTANVDPVEIILAAKGTGVKVWVGRNIPGNDISHVSMTPGESGPDGLEEVIRQIEALRQPDPLADLVAAYIAGNEAYNTAEIPVGLGPEGFKDFEEKRVASTYGPHWDRLRNDPPQATTLRGVEAILRIMSDEDEYGCLTDKGAAAAAAYFDKHREPAAATEPDPVFALIEAHRPLWVRVYAMDSEDPGWDEALDVEGAAIEALTTCQATTLAGCRAQAAYLAEYPPFRGHSDFQTKCDAFDALAAALKALVP